MSSYRSDRLNSEMLKALAVIIDGKIKDPRLPRPVTVTKVEVAKDLKTAKVYVSVYGDDEKADSALAALRSASGFVRRELSSAFPELRCVPMPDFRIDRSLEYGSKIDSILEKIGNDAHRSDKES